MGNNKEFKATTDHILVLENNKGDKIEIVNENFSLFYGFNFITQLHKTGVRSLIGKNSNIELLLKYIIRMNRMYSYTNNFYSTLLVELRDFIKSYLTTGKILGLEITDNMRVIHTSFTKDLYNFDVIMNALYDEFNLVFNVDFDLVESFNILLNNSSKSYRIKTISDFMDDVSNGVLL